jgi:hypothetical protein
MCKSCVHRRHTQAYNSDAEKETARGACKIEYVLYDFFIFPCTTGTTCSGTNSKTGSLCYLKRTCRVVDGNETSLAIHFNTLFNVKTLSIDVP